MVVSSMIRTTLPSIPGVTTRRPWTKMIYPIQALSSINPLSVEGFLRQAEGEEGVEDGEVTADVPAGTGAEVTAAESRPEISTMMTGQGIQKRVPIMYYSCPGASQRTQLLVAAAEILEAGAPALKWMSTMMGCQGYHFLCNKTS